MLWGAFGVFFCRSFCLFICRFLRFFTFCVFSLRDLFSLFGSSVFSWCSALWRFCVEEAVGGAKHFELGAAVQGVANLLFLFVFCELLDESFGEGVAFSKEVVGGCYAAGHYLRTFLAVADGCESKTVDAVTP